MKEIIEEIEEMREKINSIEDDKYKEVFNHISNILTNLTDKVEEIIVKQESLEENVGYIGEDLTDIQDELFEEVSFEDLIDIEDEYVEISCKECGKPLFVEKGALNKNNNIPCPFCNNKAN